MAKHSGLVRSIMDSSFEEIFRSLSGKAIFAPARIAPNSTTTCLRPSVSIIPYPVVSLPGSSPITRVIAIKDSAESLNRINHRDTEKNRNGETEKRRIGDKVAG